MMSRDKISDFYSYLLVKYCDFDFVVTCVFLSWFLMVSGQEDLLENNVSSQNIDLTTLCYLWVEPCLMESI